MEILKVFTEFSKFGLLSLDISCLVFVGSLFTGDLSFKFFDLIIKLGLFGLVFVLLLLYVIRVANLFEFFEFFYFLFKLKEFHERTVLSIFGR